MFWGYVLGASLMIVAGIVQAVIGVEAARKDLEEVAKPLSARRRRTGGAEPERSARRRGAPCTGRTPPVRKSSSRVPDEDIDEEVAALAAALAEAGPEGLPRNELGERVNCRLWGPGRYRPSTRGGAGARGNPARRARAASSRA